MRTVYRDEKQYLEDVKAHLDDWKDNPTMEVLAWTEWSEHLKYCLKLVYYTCEPRMDKAVEMHFLQKCKDDKIYRFRWPVPVKTDYIHPVSGTTPDPCWAPGMVEVTLRVASFGAECETREQASRIASKLFEMRG